MTEHLSQHIRKADTYLTTARHVLTSEYPIQAITPAYYAFFWVVRGLLYEKGIVTKRHSGARDMFSLHYIKPGLIPVQYSHDFATLFDQRQIADYDLDGEFPQDEVARSIQMAADFIAYIKNFHA